MNLCSPLSLHLSCSSLYSHSMSLLLFLRKHQTPPQFVALVHIFPSFWNFLLPTLRLCTFMHCLFFLNKNCSSECFFLPNLHIWSLVLFFPDLFIGCGGSLLLHNSFLLVGVSWGHSWLRCVGFLLQWRLLLWSSLHSSEASRIFLDQGSSRCPLHCKADS